MGHFLFSFEHSVPIYAKIAGMFLGNRSDSVHKYGHVVLRVLSTLCTLNRSYTIPMQAFEIVANESNEPNKAKLELKLII